MLLGIYWRVGIKVLENDYHKKCLNLFLNHSPIPWTLETYSDISKTDLLSNCLTLKISTVPHNNQFINPNNPTANQSRRRELLGPV